MRGMRRGQHYSCCRRIYQIYLEQLAATQQESAQLRCSVADLLAAAAGSSDNRGRVQHDNRFTGATAVYKTRDRYEKRDNPR
jgi:hypothetical protein